jgi:GAF domain-containing protein
MVCGLEIRDTAGWKPALPIYPEKTCRNGDAVKHRCMLHAGKPDEVLGSVTEKLQQAGEPADRLGSILDELLQHFQCSAGTIHLLGPSGFLELVVQRGLPEVVVDKIKMIPIGKGMAGIAAKRREPVQVCNLQTDTTGVARPGARDTKMEGSVAAPMISANGDLKGALGIAKPVPYEFTPTDCDLLMKIGALIATSSSL